MSTRIKKLTVAFFFIFSFAFIYTLWGTNGVIQRLELKKRVESIESRLDEKEAEIALLRERNIKGVEDRSGNVTLVHAFASDDDWIKAGANNAALDYADIQSKGLKLWECALIALIPTFIFALILFIPFGKIRRKNVRDN